MIRVLIAEDSPVVQRVLTALLDDERGIEIVGVASNGVEAVEMCRDLSPDLVTMDVFMPEMNGLEATRQIMEEHPTRIVIISSMVGSIDLASTFESLRSGAVEIIEKPHGVMSGNYSAVKATLVRVVRELMEANPTNRFSWGPPLSAQADEPQPGVASRTPAARLPSNVPAGFAPKILCIGGSTGAPAVLFDLLVSLPVDYPLPIVVAQHIAPGFAAGMADWLDTSIPLHVKVATSGTRPAPGGVLIAPDDRDLRFLPDGVVRLARPRTGAIHTPSIDAFFSSAAAAFGARSLGVILSGMGRDGARGLLEMRQAGAVTVAQNEASSVVYGMPCEAVRLGATLKEDDPQGIASLLSALGRRAPAR